MAPLTRSSAVLLATLLIPGCGSDGGDGDPGTAPETVQMITALSAAPSAEEMARAMTTVVSHGLSLGVMDENGDPLNPHATSAEVNLAVGDVEAFASLLEAQSYRTVGEVFGYIESLGVVLEGADQAITLDDFLQAIRAHVDWAFEHRNHPASLLGLLIGSGSALTVPPSAPQIDSTTPLSPVAATLLIADILIGVDAEARPSTNRRVVAAAAGEEGDGTAATHLRGLLFSRAANLLIFSVLSNEERARFEDNRELMAVFALGNHLRVQFSRDEGGGSPVAVDQAEVGPLPEPFLVGLRSSPDRRPILGDTPVRYLLNLGLYADPAGLPITARNIVFEDGETFADLSSPISDPALFRAKMIRPQSYDTGVRTVSALAGVDFDAIGTLLDALAPHARQGGVLAPLMDEQNIAALRNLFDRAPVYGAMSLVPKSWQAAVTLSPPGIDQGVVGRPYSFAAELDFHTEGAETLFSSIDYDWVIVGPDGYRLTGSGTTLDVSLPATGEYSLILNVDGTSYGEQFPIGQALATIEVMEEDAFPRVYTGPAEYRETLSRGGNQVVCESTATWEATVKGDTPGAGVEIEYIHPTLATINTAIPECFTRSSEIRMTLHGEVTGPGTFETGIGTILRGGAETVIDGEFDSGALSGGYAFYIEGYTPGMGDIGDFILEVTLVFNMTR